MSAAAAAAVESRHRWSPTRALKILLAVGVMGALIGSGQLDVERVARSLAIGPVWVLLGTGSLFVTTSLTALRWQLLLRAQGLVITFPSVLRLTLVGGFFNTFMPGGTGGDLAKAYYVWDSGRQRAAAVVSVFVDRLVGLYAMMGLAATVALLRSGELWSVPEARALVLGVPCLFAGATMALTLIPKVASLPLLAAREGSRAGRVAIAVRKVADSLVTYRNRKTSVLQALALSLATQLVMVVSFYCFDHALGLGDIDITLYPLIVPLGMVANAIPALPMGIGQGEAAFHFLYQTLAASPAGAEVALLFRVVSVWWSAVGGLFYLRLTRAALFEASRI